MIKNFLQNYGKIFLLISGLFVVSCSHSDSNEPAFRIVGLNGEKRQVQTRVPELNARIIESQGRQLPPEPYPSQAQSQQTSPDQYAALSGADVGSAALQNTLQSEQAKPTYNVAKNEADQAAGFQSKPSDSVTSVGVAEKEQEIEYDLSETEKSTKKSSKKMRLKVGKSANAGTPKEESAAAEETAVAKEEVAKKLKGIFVQVGSFSDQQNAKSALDKMKKFSKGDIEEAQSGNKTVYRVLLGPFSNDKKAKDMMKKIKSSGHDAIIVKNK